MKLSLRNSAKLKQQSGFTIVELMIATSVFAIILLVVTFGVLHFSDEYYKGVNSSTTQTAARTIIDDVAQAIQFSDAPINASTSTQFCAGNQLYQFNLGSEYLSGGGYALEQSNGGCQPVGAETELLQPRMRVTQLSVTAANGDTTGELWTVQVTVAYGDDNVLCDSSITPNTNGGGCDPSAPTLTTAQTTTLGSNVSCKQETGSQFCAVASLSTTVSRRLTAD